MHNLFYRNIRLCYIYIYIYIVLELSSTRVSDLIVIFSTLIMLIRVLLAFIVAMVVILYNSRICVCECPVGVNCP